MHKIMDYFCDQLEELENKVSREGKLSRTEVEDIKLMCKAWNELHEMEMTKEEEYSMGRNYSMRDSYRGGSYRGTSYRDSYADESYVRPDGSYARGRGAGARRDSMGRYSSEGNEAVYDVRMLLNRTHDEQTRQELSKLLDKLESM